MSKIILAIDYGEKNIGLAITDEYAKMALPYDTIQNNGVNFVIEKIKDIIKIEDVGVIIIGLPKSLNGENSDNFGLNDFVDSLNKNIDLPIDMIDERMSSKAADKFNIDKNFKKSGVRDKVAASIILQGYIDRQS